MFASPAFAQATGGNAPTGMASFLASPIPMMILIFAIFYFLVIRPQSRRAKEHRARIDAVKKNDTVVTAGGIVGKVTKVEPEEVEIEIASGVRVRAVKGTLSEIRPFGAKPAND